jgi:threonine dehydratase
MELPSFDQIREAQALIYQSMPPTPQYSWPLINQRLGTQGLGAEAWIKHENHTPVGAFKIRGALVLATWLKETQPRVRGLVAATRGNFGQGVAMAARLLGLKSIIVVPLCNSVEKNRAMIAQGAELVQHGQDFQESLEFARAFAAEQSYAIVESFHERLVWGTATFALEFFEGAPELDRIYVPIGMGSSICGVAAARNALKLRTEIVGVTSAMCPAYARSFEERKLVEAPARTLISDGQACRTPNLEALEIIWKNVARIVEVSDEEIADAMGFYYQDTHNVVEGAGAASLAAALKEKSEIKGKRIGVVVTGGNVDRETFIGALSGAFQKARHAASQA